VARLDGKVVFCNGGLPGELVLAEITRSKARYSQASMLEILRKGSQRIPAVCDHDAECGGCTWQDLAYEQQLAYKKNQVVQTLARIGGLEDVTVCEVLGAPAQFGYRNKMEFSFHVTGDNSFTLGLHRRGRWDDIFDLTRCHLCSPIFSEAAAWLRTFVREKQIPVYDVERHTGFMRFLMIREGHNTGQVMVNIVTNYGDLPHQQELVGGLRAAFPTIATIVHNQNGQKSNISAGEIETVLHGPGFIEELVGGKIFRIRANSFFQTNTRQTEQLYQTGFDQLSLTGEERLLDLYCGTGTIGILAASRVREVVGVELVADAIIAARENADSNKIENISFFEGNVKDVLQRYEAEPRPFEVIIVDPPRAGLHPKALKRLIAMDAPQVLYISCNPATFARDAGELTAAGYQVSPVQPVDMFPHTMHIELVGRFSRP
jgi:23S rRNA (uracil1939-C5)-methyltransferase